MAKEKFSLAEAMRGAIGDASVASMGAGNVSAGEQRNGTPADTAADAVSNSDTTREQIEYIDIDRLVADEKNFYSLDGIDELAANIELCGLQQPLRVRPIPDTPDFKIVSGHRRFTALKLLIDEGKNQFSTVPCIVNRNDVSPAMQELMLICANSDTRRMNDADIAKQAERVTELLYQLKEEGIEFPGRMRDRVAEACKISATKLATLKVIREKLPEQYRAEFESGKMSTDAAYKLAKMPTALQDRICRAFKTAPEANKVDRLLNVHKERKGCMWEPALRCPNGAACSHGDAFLRHDANCYSYEHCGGKTCCLKCDQATRSWSPCGSACAQAKKLRAEQRQKNKDAEEKRKESDMKKTRRAVSKILQRLVPLIDAAGLSDSEQIPLNYTSYKIKTIREYAAGEFGRQNGYFSESSYDPKYMQGTQLAALAKKLNCSADYLIGLTDDPTPTWRTGEPEEDVPT